MLVSLEMLTALYILCDAIQKLTNFSYETRKKFMSHPSTPAAQTYTNEITGKYIVWAVEHKGVFGIKWKAL